ncbi:hypothetical protein FACS189449_01500 [Alphaproteobacteria bacterium]|nr:hypothetical protein FACS189449_01500 [Alphaproteobacteria bacterium]
MHISMTEFRNKMFQIMPNLKPHEEIIVTHNCTDSYVIRRTALNRSTEFNSALAKCPKLNITDEQVLAFKNDGRK